MPSGIFTLKQQTLAVQEAAWPGTKTPAVNYLVVAGGGGCGSVGGGGGGGLLTGSLPVPLGSALTVTVGAGGSTGAAGTNSVFNTIVANGGGSVGINAGAGGSGGGGNHSGILVGGQGISGQGNRGGDNISGTTFSGGGGGAGSVGYSSTSSGGGYGGVGVASDISGIRTAYAGGGGGSGSGTQGLGGAGGGGNAVSNATGGPNSGAANTGGGSGGTYAVSGGNGGSGIVIISYPDTYAAPTSTTGSPTVSTSGSGCISFGGTSAIRYDGQSAFSFGTGNFTIEAFVYLDSFSGGDIVIYDSRPAGTQGAYPLIYFNSSTIYYFVNTTAAITGSAALSTGSWMHIEVCRIGTSTRMFVNGTQVGSTFTDTNNYLIGSAAPTVGGSSFSFGGNLMNGRVSNLRVIKGTGLHSANFTPPTAPVTAVSGTSLLLNSVSGSFLADSSGNGFTATTTGTPTWNSASPFATGLGYKNRVYTWTSSGSITF